MGMMCMKHVSEQIENSCGVQFHYSEQLTYLTVVQHKMNGTRMYKWLLQHFLFPENSGLYWISTGVLDDGEIESWETGIKDIKQVVDPDLQLSDLN